MSELVQVEYTGVNTDKRGCRRKSGRSLRDGKECWTLEAWLSAWENQDGTRDWDWDVTCTETVNVYFYEFGSAPDENTAMLRAEAMCEQLDIKRFARQSVT